MRHRALEERHHPGYTPSPLLLVVVMPLILLIGGPHLGIDPAGDIARQPLPVLQKTGGRLRDGARAEYAPLIHPVSQNQGDDVLYVETRDRPSCAARLYRQMGPERPEGRRRPLGVAGLDALNRVGHGLGDYVRVEPHPHPFGPYPLSEGDVSAVPVGVNQLRSVTLVG